MKFADKTGYTVTNFSSLKLDPITSANNILTHYFKGEDVTEAEYEKKYLNDTIKYILKPFHITSMHSFNQFLYQEGTTKTYSDYIKEWLNNDSSLELYEYLGLTRKRFESILMEPDINEKFVVQKAEHFRNKLRLKYHFIFTQFTERFKN